MAEGEELKKALDIIRWVQKNIQLTRWEHKDLDKIGARSVDEIINSGHTNYMNPCVDKTITTAVLLKEAGLKPKLVIHERIGRQTNGPVIHFAIETPLDGKTHTIDFPGLMVAQVYGGKFDPIKSSPYEKSLAVHRFPTTGFNRSSTLEGLVFGGRLKHFNRSHLAAVISAMKRTDSPMLYMNTKKVRPKIRRL